jgi:hypothetical protein
MQPPTAGPCRSCGGVVEAEAEAGLVTCAARRKLQRMSPCWMQDVKHFEWLVVVREGYGVLGERGDEHWETVFEHGHERETLEEPLRRVGTTDTARVGACHASHGCCDSRVRSTMALLAPAARGARRQTTARGRLSLRLVATSLPIYRS